jgi:hypothetical protein
MNLCEKNANPINKDGRFCSLRKTMFFAEVKKEILPPRRRGVEREKTG